MKSSTRETQPISVDSPEEAECAQPWQENPKKYGNQVNDLIFFLVEASGRHPWKQTMFNDPVGVDGIILIPRDVGIATSCDNEFAFVIPQELKSIYGFIWVEEFVLKGTDAFIARYAVQNRFEIQPEMVGLFRRLLLFTIVSIDTKSYDSYQS